MSVCRRGILFRSSVFHDGVFTPTKSAHARTRIRWRPWCMFCLATSWTLHRLSCGPSVGCGSGHMELLAVWYAFCPLRSSPQAHVHAARAHTCHVRWPTHACMRAQAPLSQCALLCRAQRGCVRLPHRVTHVTGLDRLIISSAMVYMSSKMYLFYTQKQKCRCLCCPPLQNIGTCSLATETTLATEAVLQVSSFFRTVVNVCVCVCVFDGGCETIV